MENISSNSIASLAPNTNVRHKNNPGRVGTLTGNKRERGTRIYYQVKYSDGSNDYIFENELESDELEDFKDPYQLIQKGSFGRSLDLRQNLTFVNLSGNLANNVYSMGITGTDFYAHQYKPLLTLMESPSNGILIADEVGLGKTIEAGLIWTEMRARYDMRKLLIVCPAMLREKWKDELLIRFGIKASIVDPKQLLEEVHLSKNLMNEGEAWICSYQSMRPPKGWRSEDFEKSKNKKILLNRYFEDNVDNEKLFDLTIFDEAHYMRNDSSTTSELGLLIRDVSDYNILLSATPINLKNQDLFNLLKLTDPDHFRDLHDFQEMIESNKPLNKARDLVLNITSNSKEIIETLEEAKKTKLLNRSAQLTAILDKKITNNYLKNKEYRAELADSISKINLLGHVLTRTRKKEIHQERPKRIVHRESVKMSEIEKLLYQNVTDSIRSYAEKNEIVTGFLLATFQRQISSCPAATFNNWKNYQLDQEETYKYSDIEISDEKKSNLKNFIIRSLPDEITYSDLYKSDSKFNQLNEVLKEYLNEKENENEKVILFTTFRATAKYLFERLQENGISSLLLWGNMEYPKQNYIDEFKASKNLKVLISTEVASEGVDLQFSSFLINYDLPWNPMRVEQRIGRIDRLGQKSQKLNIWNLYYKDSIDDRIVNRLFERIQIFEESLGEHEAIIGEEIVKLESNILTKKLTEKEENEKIDIIAQVIENIKIEEKNLEKNAANLISHGGFLLEKIEAAQEFNKRITEKDLIIYVQDYLNNYAPGHIFRQQVGEDNRFEIKLPAEICAKFDDFLRSKNLLSQTRLSDGILKQYFFQNKINKIGMSGIELITQLHPLIRFISNELKIEEKAFYPLVEIDVESEKFDNGQYMFCIKKFSFEGMKSEEYLNYKVIDLHKDKILNSNQSEEIVNLGRLNGSDHIGGKKSKNLKLIEKKLDILEMNIDDDFEKMFISKKNENSDRFLFQIRSIELYLERKLPGLQETYEKMLNEGKKAGAKLRLGQINKLKEKSQVQISKIKLKEKIESNKIFVCAGLINII
jgi:superfamily II DNA or RNA helicase